MAKHKPSFIFIINLIIRCSNKILKFQYPILGVLRIKMDDGTILECVSGDVSYLPMDHDAWVVGDAPVGLKGFQG